MFEIFEHLISEAFFLAKRHCFASDQVPISSNLFLRPAKKPALVVYVQKCAFGCHAFIALHHHFWNLTFFAQTEKSLEFFQVFFKVQYFLESQRIFDGIFKSSSRFMYDFSPNWGFLGQNLDFWTLCDFPWFLFRTICQH